MSKGYWISVYEKIEDPKILSEYAKKATIAIQGHQGNFLCRGGKNICLEGSAKPRTVVVEFPSFDLAKQAYDSSVYREALNILKGSVKRNLQIIEGV
ncbi:MAG: DUF1330 domain-containing protein [Pelagibacteraceae bacterium]|jgi:uncharacterized protein (DUF1330 family)|nr:DUF1330 domain-containing protein [Pelagibacteraceae bacterium]